VILSLHKHFTLTINTIVLLCVALTCSKEELYTYRHYLEDKENLSNVNILLQEDRIERALTLLDKNQCKGVMCLEEQLLRWKIEQNTISDNQNIDYLLNASSLGFVVPEGLLIELDDNDKIEILKEKRKFNSKLDSNLIEWLNEATAIDQKIRGLWKAAKKSEDSIALNRIVEEVRTIDTSNLSGLKKYVEKNGWPGVTTIGRVGGMLNLPPSLLVKHYNKSFNDFILNEVIKSAEKGEEDWSTAEEIQRNILIRFKEANGFRGVNLTGFPNRMTDYC